MLTNLKHFKWASLVSGLLFLLVGMITFLNPINQLAHLAFILIIVWLVGGIVDFIGFFTSNNPFRSGLDLLIGSINLGFALLLLSSDPITFVLLLPTLIAYWLIMVSTFRLIAAVSINVGYMLKNLFFWYALIGIVVGFTLLYHPFLKNLTTTVMITLTFLQYTVFAITRFTYLNELD